MTPPSLNDLMYAFFGQTSSLADAQYAFYLAAYNAGVTGAGIIGASYVGPGSPEGVVTAPVGSLYRDTTNGVVYLKHTGTGNTGWTIGNGGAPPTGAAGGDLGGTYPNPTVAPTNNVAMSTHKITGLGDPTAAQDATTKNYVDALVNGLSPKGSCKLATAAALPTNAYSAGVLTATGFGALTVDSVAVAVNDRILVKNEVAAANNGIYTVTATGGGAAFYVLTRSTDMNTGTQVPGAYAFVEAGTVNVGTGWVVADPGPFTIGVTAINWVEFAGASILKAIGTAKGDLIGFTGSGVPVRIGVGSDGQALIADAASSPGVKWAARTPIQLVRRATGSAISLNSTSIAEVAAATNGPGTGGFDLTVAAKVGDVLEVAISGTYNSEVVGASMDVYTMVSGSRVNPFGAGLSSSLATTVGVSQWFAPANIGANWALAGSCWLTVQSGDISSGNVTVRPHYVTASAAVRSLAASANVPLVWTLKNLGS